MVSKIVEIRDAGTFIPALAVQLGSDVEDERCLLTAAGYGETIAAQSEYIVLCKINGGEPCDGHIDPFAWGQNPRTMFIAHRWLQEHFEELPAGGIIDVELILGLRDAPKLSDRISIESKTIARAALAMTGQPSTKPTDTEIMENNKKLAEDYGI